MSTCHAKSLDSEVKAPLGWAEMPLLWSLHCVIPPVLNRYTTRDALTSTSHNFKPKKLLKHTGGSPSPARSSTTIKLSMRARSYGRGVVHSKSRPSNVSSENGRLEQR